MTSHDTGQKLKENIFYFSDKTPSSFGFTRSLTLCLLVNLTSQLLLFPDPEAAEPVPGMTLCRKSVQSVDHSLRLCLPLCVVQWDCNSWSALGPESRVKGEPSKLFSSQVAILGLTLLTSSHSPLSGGLFFLISMKSLFKASDTWGLIYSVIFLTYVYMVLEFD